MSSQTQQHNSSPHFTLFVLLPFIICMFLLYEAWMWLQAHGGQLWNTIHGWVIVIVALIILGLLIWATWRIRMIYLAHKREDDMLRLENEILEDEEYAKQIHNKITTESHLLIQQARINQDNVKVKFGDDGALEEFEVIRSRENVQANHVIIQELMQQVEELKQLAAQNQTAQLAAPVGATTDTIHLTENYAIPADDVLSARKLFVGISGSGKSNSIGAYAEELGELGVPFVLADTEDEYEPLCDPKYLPHGILAGATGQYSIMPDQAEQFGRFVLDQRMQVVLNLASYDMPTAALVMIGIINGMRQWQEERDNSQRIPSDFILEEAVTWLPQYVRESPLQKAAPDILAALQGIFFNDMTRKGRKRGLGLGVVCQKLAELDNRAMQSDFKVLHRQSEQADLERYAKWGISPEETLALQNGEAFLITSRVSKMKVQIRRRNSPHGGDTPGLKNLRMAQNSRVVDAFETTRNFDFSGGNVRTFGSAFDQSEKSFHNISTFPQSSQKSSKNRLEDVPENIRQEIENLYNKDIKRTDIQTQMSLNGDEYWMIREVCNYVDKQRSAL